MAQSNLFNFCVGSVLHNSLRTVLRCARPVRWAHYVALYGRSPCRGVRLTWYLQCPQNPPDSNPLCILWSLLVFYHSILISILLISPLLLLPTWHPVTPYSLHYLSYLVTSQVNLLLLPLLPHPLLFLLLPLLHHLPLSHGLFFMSTGKSFKKNIFGVVI